LYKILKGGELLNFDLQKLKIENAYMEKIIMHNDYNKLIMKYYNQLKYQYYILTDDKKILKTCRSIDNKVMNINNCNKFWLLDYYKKLAVKDFKETNLCHDKFCNNCKKVKQAARMIKFIPELTKYKRDLYHLVLTIPDVVVSEQDHFGQSLKAEMTKMIKSFRMLIRYLDSKKKIKDLEFKKYKYKGAIRSFEVTYKENKYHPHLHVAIVLKGQLGVKDKVNRYSYSYKNKKTTKFSDFEILIQKIWYLLMNDIRVTKKNIDELEFGYSCMINKFKDENYKELFKYITKTDEVNWEKELKIMSYEQFLVLHYNLFKLRQLQGYGVLYNIGKDIDLDFEAIDEFYQEIIEYLKDKESPEEIRQSPLDILQSVKKDKITVISKKKIYNYLKNINQ